MREKIISIIQLIFLLSMTICVAIIGTKYEQQKIDKAKQQDEQIKILEQSLNEQIQEKEVYMKMLEDKK